MSRRTLNRELKELEREISGMTNDERWELESTLSLRAEDLAAVCDVLQKEWDYHNGKFTTAKVRFNAENIMIIYDFWMNDLYDIWKRMPSEYAKRLASRIKVLIGQMIKDNLYIGISVIGYLQSDCMELLSLVIDEHYKAAIKAKQSSGFHTVEEIIDQSDSETKEVECP